MPNVTEPQWRAEFIVSEGNGHISRDTITLIAGQNLTASTVLGKITASGKYTAYNPAAGDGSQNAAVVLIADTNASAADTLCPALVRLAEVNASELNWGSANAGQITTGIASLAGQNILVRTAL